MALMTTMPMREQNARRFLAIAGTIGVLGVALNLNSEDSTLPKLIAVLGVVMLVWSIHRFGRLGPDETIAFEEPELQAPAKKKKKKKKKAEPAAAAVALTDLEGTAAPADDVNAEPAPSTGDASASEKPKREDV
jgi:hypothetical protein